MWYILKYGPIPASFLFIFVAFTSQFNCKLKKRRSCAWDSYPGGRMVGKDGVPLSYGTCPMYQVYVTPIVSYLPTVLITGHSCLKRSRRVIGYIS